MQYVRLSPKLQEEVDNVAFVYEPAFSVGKYEGAFEAYSGLYNLLLKEQPVGQRYHKGYPLHNMGYALFLQGDLNKALHYFTLAYVEDLLSEEKGEEDKADQTPAGRVLRQAYRSREALFTRLKSIVRAKKEQGQVVANPEHIIVEFAQSKKPESALVEMAQEQPPTPAKDKSHPGMFQQPWDTRVFIGASYKEIAIINDIRKAVVARGYEPVVASDFEIPRDLIHHHSLMLLHECKYAIFDFSQEAGQLMEFERTRDYEVKTLAVYQSEGGEPKVTEMLKALLHRMRLELKLYADSDEALRKLVNEFLPKTN